MPERPVDAGDGRERLRLAALVANSSQSRQCATKVHQSGVGLSEVSERKPNDQVQNAFSIALLSS
jgi:hypothetical protein